MARVKLTGKQTLLLGKIISLIEIAKSVAEESDKNLKELEESMVGVESPLSLAVTDAVGDIDEAISNMESAAAVCDFAYEDCGERRVSKMLRGMKYG